MSLHYPFHAAALVRDRYHAATAQSWSKGMNAALDDDAPAYVLRQKKLTDGAQDVIAVAKSFASVG